MGEIKKDGLAKVGALAPLCKHSVEWEPLGRIIHHSRHREKTEMETKM